MRNSFLRLFSTFILVLFGWVIQVNAQTADVIKATGGTNISIDLYNEADPANPLGYVPITGPSIRETASGQLIAGETIELTLPSGYKWNTAANVTLLIEPIGAILTGLEASITSVSAQTLVITIDNQSETKGAGQGPGRIDILGLEVGPTAGITPDEQILTNTGSTAPSGVSYGSLSKKPGSIDQLLVESQADGNGQVVPTQEWLAGSSLTVYAIGRDKMGNYIGNVALQNESAWTLINTTGGVTQTALEPSLDLKSATFSSQITGSAQIQADSAGLTTITPSGVISFAPRSAAQMIMNQQPPAFATAGVQHSGSTIIELRDQFGNLVTTDSETQATISITSGQGTLSGTLTKQAVNGIITFDDLSSDIANSIQLSVTSNGLSTIVTNTISVDHGAASDLLYLVQPSNTAQNKTIKPNVELQLIDDYGNYVDSVLTVTISGSFFKANSVLSVSSDASGKAIFSALNLTNTATLGLSTISASFPGINATVVSDTFEIISANSLAKFVIQTLNDTPFGDQTAGTTFDIRMRALDGNNTVFTAFNDTVRLTSNSQITVGGTPVDAVTTPAFVNGVLNTTITLTSAGQAQLFIENTAVAREGVSNEFTVLPSTYVASTSEIYTDPTEIVANGNNTATIIAQLKDIYGNNLITGGETVEFSTTSGTFSGNSTIAATDQSDGTYTAILTSGTNASDSAFVTATVNSEAIPDTGIVDFIPGSVAALTVNTPAAQVAGAPFSVNLTAVDLQGNVVPSFNGTATLIATNSVITNGSTVTFINGAATADSVILTKSGTNISLSATANELFNINGNSSTFSVTAASAAIENSIISVSPKILKNAPTNSSLITITLRDAFNNKVLTQEITDVTGEQIFLDGSPSSGTPDANISALNFISSNSTYTATLTPTTTVESIELTGYIGTSASGSAISVKDTIQIEIPNTWTAGASGPSSVKTNWTNPDNWTAGVPTSDDVVVIPDIGDVPVLNLSLTLGSFEVDPGVTLTLFEGNDINVTGNVQLDGILDIEANTTLSINGNLNGNGTLTAADSSSINIQGDISVPTFFARTSGTNITLDGAEEQRISSMNFLAEILTINNNVIADATINFIDTNELIITAGNSFELETSGTDTIDVATQLTGEGSILLNNNTLLLNGNSDIANLEASQGTIIIGVRENETDYSALTNQQISNLGAVQNIIVNNPQGVRTFDDIIVTGTLNLVNGPLILGSGKSLIASTTLHNLGSVRMERIINNASGWRMLSAPLDTTFADFLDKTVTQGYPNSTLGNAPADSLQPNVLWYDAAYSLSDSTGSDGTTPRTATDNDRWRAPTDANESITAGRGYFVYFFGSIAEDNRYNTPLPLTLDIQGLEHTTTGSTFNFPDIAYNDASEGWNLVGNPFPASVSWDNAGWTKTNVDNVVYVWDPVTNDYFYWNGIGGGSLDGTKLSNGIIKPMQAFWVKANSTGASLSLDTSAKTTNGSFLGKYQRNPEVVGLSLSGNGSTKSTHITFSPDGKTSKDTRDAFRLLPFETNSYLEFYSTLSDGTELAINNFARDFGTEIEIPLHVGAFEDGYPLNGTFEISLHNVADLPSAWTITLVDTETNREVNLKEEISYSFTLNQAPQKRVGMNTVNNFSLRNKPEKAKGTTESNARFRLKVAPGEDAAGLPDTFTLYNNYPNPFNPATTLEFAVPLEGPVKIEIYDVLGRKVSTLVNSNYQAGYHKIRWDATGYSSGLYLAVFRAGGTEKVKKLTLIK